MRESNYGLFEIVQNIYFVLKTKIFFHKCRMIRFPFYVRGKKYIDFGKSLTTGRFCRIEVYGNHYEKVLVMGDSVNIGDGVSVRCAKRVTIGDSVLIGSRVLIIDNSHGVYSGNEQESPLVPPNLRKIVATPVTIGNNVWIGEQSIILPGVNIGNGSVIGANSVVMNDIPENCIAVGSPARIVKKWNTSKREWEKVI